MIFLTKENQEITIKTDFKPIINVTKINIITYIVNWLEKISDIQIILKATYYNINNKILGKVSHIFGLNKFINKNTISPFFSINQILNFNSFRL